MPSIAAPSCAIGSPALSATSKDPLIEKLKCLRPPGRLSWSRLFGGRPQREQHLGLAQLVHARIRVCAGHHEDQALKDAGTPEGTRARVKSFLDRAPALSKAREGGLFDAALRLAGPGADHAAVRALLEADSPARLIDSLAQEIRARDKRRSPADGQRAAEVVYMALVSAVAASDADAAAAKTRALEARLAELESGPRAPEHRLRELEALRGQLVQDKGLAGQGRFALLQRADSLRISLCKSLPQHARDRLDAFDSALSVRADATSLAAYRAEFQGLLEQLRQQGPSPRASAAGQLEGRLSESLHLLGRLEGRTAYLDTFKGSDEILRFKELLSGFDARAYAAAVDQLAHITATVRSSESDVRQCLATMIRSKDQWRWLGDIRQGDAGIVDLVFQGPEWQDDAALLKRAPVQEKYDAALDRLGAEFGGEPPPERVEALRRSFEQDFMDLEAQHQLGIASRELDRAMQALAASGQSAGAHLPSGAFRALQADATLVRWLATHASEFLGTHNLLVANWVSLSLRVADSRARAGAAPAGVPRPSEQALFAQLGLDPDTIDCVQKGFASTAAVRACGEQLNAALRELARFQLAEVEEARDPLFKARRVAGELVQSLTGAPGPLEPSRPDRIREALLEMAPWLAAQESLAQAKARRATLLQQLAALTPWSHEGASARAWMAQPRELAQQEGLHAKVRVAIACLQKLEGLQADKNATSAQRQAAVDRLVAAQQQLQGFSLETLRFEPRLRNQLPHIASLKDPSLRQSMDLLARLSDIDWDLADLEKRQPTPAEEMQASEFAAQAARIAALEVAQELRDPAFTPAAHVPAILKRLKPFGLDHASSSPWVRATFAHLAEMLQADRRSLAELCAAYDPRSLGNRAREAIQGAARPAPLHPARKPSRTATEAAGRPGAALGADTVRRENAQLIRQRFDELQPRQSFAIQLGQFTRVHAPVSGLLAVNATARSEQRSAHVITIGLDEQGRYSIEFERARNVKSDVVVSAFEALSLAVGASAGSATGFRFTFEDAERCRLLVTALAAGDELDPAAWRTATRVERLDRTSHAGQASVALELDGGVASAKAQAYVGADTRVTGWRTANGSREIHSRAVRAGARVEAGTAVSAVLQAETGIDLQVRRSIGKRMGLLERPCELDLTATVVGGNRQACLRAVLPPSLRPQAERYAEQIGEQADGTEISLRCELTEAALQQANRLLATSLRKQGEAAPLPPGSRDRQALLQEAEQARREAYGVLGKPESYVATALGWTSKSLAELSKGMVYGSYAGSEKTFTDLIPLPVENRSGPAAGLRDGAGAHWLLPLLP